MADIAGQILTLRNLASETRSILVGVDEILTGPKPVAGELDSIRSDGLTYEIDDLISVLVDAKELAATIANTIRDDRPQAAEAVSASTLSEDTRAYRVS